MMIKAYRFVGLAISMLLVASSPRALNAAGMPALRLNTGPRGAALANAMTAVRDVEAPSANPAALATRDNRTLALGHTAWIQDLRINSLAYNLRAGRTVWAVGSQLFQAEELERRTGPSLHPVGSFGVYEGAIRLTLAHSLHNNLQLGATVQAIRQALDIHTANGAAVDLGLLYRLAPGYRLGFAAQHLGRMGKLDRSATQLPAVLRGGVAYDGHPHLLISLEAQRARGLQTTLHAGVEVTWAPGLAIRAGYQNADSRDLSGGIGIDIGAWTLDYAYIPFRSGLGQAHRLSLQRHR